MEIDWKEEFLKIKEYSVALEHTRADLMELNEDLHEKILKLEAGQLALLEYCRAFSKQMNATISDLALDRETSQLINQLLNGA